VARNATLEEIGYLKGCRDVLHDRDKKHCAEFRDNLAAGGVECVPWPAHSPILEANNLLFRDRLLPVCPTETVVVGSD
jgi:hypothetical protein